MFFSAIVRGPIKQKNPSFEISDVSKAIEKAWQNLSDSDKQPYDLLSKQDEIRYQEELTKFKQADKQKISYAKKSDQTQQGPIDYMLEDLPILDQKSKTLKVTGSHHPKKPCSSYMQFFAHSQVKIRKENPGIRQSEIYKIVGQLWIKLSDAEKEPYQKLSQQDKIRHQNELKEFNEKGYFTNQKGENSAEIFKPKITNDVVQPKNALCAWVYFTKSMIYKFKGDANMSNAKVMKKSGEIWKAMTDQEKKPYVDQADQDRIRYQQEMDQLLTHGYFINSDGVKSTDLAPKKNKKVKNK